jgi:hypothetical protein
MVAMADFFIFEVIDWLTCELVYVSTLSSPQPGRLSLSFLAATIALVHVDEFAWIELALTIFF